MIFFFLLGYIFRFPATLSNEYECAFLPSQILASIRYVWDVDVYPHLAEIEEEFVRIWNTKDAMVERTKTECILKLGSLFELSPVSPPAESCALS